MDVLVFSMDLSCFYKSALTQVLHESLAVRGETDATARTVCPNSVQFIWVTCQTIRPLSA